MNNLNFNLRNEDTTILEIANIDSNFARYNSAYLLKLNFNEFKPIEIEVITTGIYEESIEKREE